MGGRRAARGRDFFRDLADLQQKVISQLKELAE
jgi:hypothetical protein